ncbi:MAG: glycosyltransferase family 4 protein, partial [Chloroflexi bacterium]|nr:glycosyltransferase family 4 protein [Chloroflexota bacterium]
EWITPGVEGWLFRDGDDSALADGILEALRQREQMAEMGAAARRLAEQRADWQVNFQTMLQGYTQAVQSPHRKSAIKRRDLIF